MGKTQADTDSVEAPGSTCRTAQPRARGTTLAGALLDAEPILDEFGDGAPERLVRTAPNPAAGPNATAAGFETSVPAPQGWSSGKRVFASASFDL
ncbi:hypothetical protein Isolate57596_50800 (plasmid) [Mycobacteroides abscessus subsp. abscessus]